MVLHVSHWGYIPSDIVTSHQDPELRKFNYLVPGLDASSICKLDGGHLRFKLLHRWYIGYFDHFCDQTPDKKQLKGKKVYFGSCVSHRVQRVQWMITMAVGTHERCLLISHQARKQSRQEAESGQEAEQTGNRVDRQLRADRKQSGQKAESRQEAESEQEAWPVTHFQHSYHTK